ncbi:CLUMA_CG015140, isoform A [Clunio marinus]|uniref:Cilia- and flagella-associated protein 43 n=1 Tax=Clunio marinus TaxID=568069 RepID=A0A1J1IQA7_9DIPT|nr:CLUMA_CG015140, isoform A [Clunio marinus]
MEELAKFSVITKWIKLNEVKNGWFVGNDAIAYNLGSHIVFMNLTTGLETFYRADLTNGDGVSCLTGHKIFPIFAFAENCWNAKIFIISYPDFTKVSILESKGEYIFISLAFSETEHLIALTGMPHYKIQVWFWRTQDMLINENSELITDKQRITCSSSLPLTVAQFAFSKGKLIVWEVHGTQKFCKLIKRKISLDFDKSDGPFQEVYSIEGNIQIVNRHGDIYYVIPSSRSVNLITKRNGNKGDFNSCIAYIRNGILVSGPDGTLKFYKRQKYVWNEMFQISTSDAFITLKGYHDNETAIGMTVDGGIYKIHLLDGAPSVGGNNRLEGEKLSMTKIKSYDASYSFFAMIYPKGEYLVAVKTSNEIFLESVETGEKVAKINIENQTIIQSNPRLPFIAVGNSHGDVTFISLNDPKAPKVLTEFLLSRRSIKTLRFSHCGDYLVAIDNEFNIFVIKCSIGETMNIMHHFKESLNIVEFFVIASQEKIELLLLCSANDDSLNGNQLVRITILNDDDKNIFKNEWKLPKFYMQVLPFMMSTSKFYAIKNGSSLLEIIEISEEDKLVVVDVIDTPHQLRHLEAFNDGRHLITWGMDGIVAAYDSDNNHALLTAFVACNRHNFGIKIAHVDAKCKYVVVIDQSGNLICSTLNVERSLESYQNLINLIENDEQNSIYLFSQDTSGGFPGLQKEHIGKKFTDLKSEQTYQMEAKESEETRKILFGKLKRLRSQIRKMLDENEICPEDERLEIQDFNLDLVTAEQKESNAREDRNHEEKKMMDYIEAQTVLNDWIISKCWNPMEVKGAKLRGMFINMFVDNYPLLPEVKDKEMERIVLLRAVENSVALEDTFLPWRPIPTMELEKVLAKEPGMFELNTNDMTQFTEHVSNLMGTKSYKQIKVSPLHYQQLDVVTFHQMRIEKFLIHKEQVALKKEFNKKFDALHRMKEYQIDSIRFKNDRLRHIQSEMRILDEMKGLKLESMPQILDPDFQPDEMPDTVINVIESEVCVSPYISPSYKKMLEDQEAAREKRRRELEADDFRDRALDAMMDGVLEHKWEDEIKKNPKKPDCLIKNKPRDDLTEMELRDVDEYNQKVKQILTERDKYRRMLYEEQKLLQSILDDEIHNYNYNLCSLMMEKLKMDMVIEQEEMKLLLMTQYNFRRVSYQKREIEIRLKMEQMKVTIEGLSHLQADLQDWIKDIKTNYENLQMKDKTLERQFKANFNEAAPGAPVDQAFKYFKRRPKLQMRAQITSSILLEVAKRVSSKKQCHQVTLLPPECLEYLHGIDLLDLVSSSTTGIDSISWQILCKMRRIKIESEFKIKSLGLQLADAEATLTAYTKETINKRNYLQSIERSLVELKEARENDSINRYVQLVMRRGLIEIPLTGSFSDFKDSVLIHRSDVDDINRIIIKAGMKKLRALENAAMFRRKISMKEWEHKVLKLKVCELKEFVKTIEKCKITKEVQQWLKREWTEDLSENSLNRHIENSINAHEKILNDLMQEDYLLDKKITRKKMETKDIDDQIQKVNIDVSEKNLMRDIEFEREEIKAAKERMLIITERAKIVRHIQYQHSNLLQLNTLLELQRLKTYPTLTLNYSGRYQKSYP